MSIRIAAKPARAAARPHRIVPVLARKRSLFESLPSGVRREAQALAKVRGFEAAPGQTLLLYHQGVQWLLTGLGKQGELTRHGLSAAIGKALVELRAAGAEALDVILPEGLPFDTVQSSRLATEGLAMAGYAFDHYQGQSRRKAPVDAALTGPGQQPAIRTGVGQGLHVAAGIELARDLINQPAAVAHPGYMVAQARALGRSLKVPVKVIRGEALRSQGYEALYAVGAAAAHPPALVALEYGRRRRGHPTLALVGKGVTFDSGGLDLKPSNAMALMKKDMGGAAITLGAFRAVAGLGLPIHLVAVVGLAENAVGPQAYHPGDILRSKAGLTIEITNTDAEGRVVLADTMALARAYNPTHMIDFATLTGAARIALGKEIMALFCDDSKLRGTLEQSAQATGEALWALPLWTPYRKRLDSPVADLVNATTDGFGGAITAALFLKEFAGDVAWAHLDCYAWSDGGDPLFPRGGNGVGVRLITEVVSKLTEGLE